jgi:hypothetical protein
LNEQSTNVCPIRSVMTRTYSTVLIGAEGQSLSCQTHLLPKKVRQRARERL